MKGKRPAQKKDPFRNVSAGEACRSKETKPALNTRREASSVYIEELHTNASQLRAIEELYDLRKCEDQKFEMGMKEQLKAAACLSSHRLDPSARELVSDRWSIRWSKRTGKGDKETKRVLYQCDCGASEEATKSRSRRNPLPFTACLVHAEVTYKSNSTDVLRIRGFFEHNEACRNAKYTDNRPVEPLHPIVLQECLSMLKSGCSLTDIQQRNALKFIARSYPGMPTTTEGLKEVSFRWNLLKSDTRSLYRHLNRLQGIDVTEAPHINIHRWLDPQSPAYNKILADAVFHYQARANRDERFEVCIATADMQKAAWEVSHRRQVLMDGTFGLCEAKLLLFIMMGVDAKNRGVPLAFLFFSAPAANKATSSGYDHAILQKLLQLWKDSLGKREGKEFSPAVVITDTDAKERKAGVLVFPDTEFILCHFHVRQSWRNHRTRLLRGDSQVHHDVRKQLRVVEAYLLESEIFKDAVQFVKKKISDFEAISEPSDAVVQGLLHLQYFLSYWLASEALWMGFSPKGRLLAAKRVGCDVDLIVTTTNHLESFNGVLKGKYIQNSKRGGRRLRVDVLIFIMVTSIGPAIFQKRQIEDEAEEISLAKLRSLPGGEALAEKRREYVTKIRWKGKRGAYLTSESRTNNGLFFAVDAVRDAAALELLTHRQISAPALRDENDGFTFTCYSSTSLEGDANPTTYIVDLLINGTGGCTCLDFKNRGGACKHLRAALRRLTDARAAAPSIPVISFPTSEEEYRALTASLNVTATSMNQNEGSQHILEVRMADPLEKALEAVHDTFGATSNARMTTDGLDIGEEPDMEGEIEEDMAASSQVSSDIEEEEAPPTIEKPACHAQHAIDDQSLLRVLIDLEHDEQKQKLHFSLLEGIEMNDTYQERVEQVQARMAAYVELFERLKTRGRATTATTAMGTEHARSTPQGPCTQPHNAQPPQSPRTERRQHNKRPIEDIIPPSPEKTSSKRHQSYSIH